MKISVKRNGEDITHLTKLRKQGRGTKIERIAQPIARFIDKVTGTKIAGCGGCKKMVHRLDGGMTLGEALKLRVQGK